MINYSATEKLYHIGVDKTQVGRYVLLTGDPKRCEKIASYLDEPELMADIREYTTYTGSLLGERVSVCSTGIGGPSASIALEELAMCGADTFIRIGTAGGMDLSVESGDIVIANAAIRMDGTSKEYVPLEWPATADFSLTSDLLKASESLNFRYHIGTVQSKDSFYGQHRPETMPNSAELVNKWEAWIRMGCKASEMECASLFTVGAFLRVKVAAVLFIMSNQERAKLGMSNNIAYDTDQAIHTAVEAMKLRIEKDRASN